MTALDAWWKNLGAGPLLYLAPHSDDAALSSAGLLHTCAARGTPVHIITCFSRSGHARGDLGSDPDVVSRIRKDEDRTFAAALPGPVTLSWLDFDDAPLRPQHRGKHPCKETSLTAADRALGEALERRLAPDVAAASVVMAPLALGSHIDHLIVRDLAVKLARGGHTQVALWEDLPYAGRLSTPVLQREMETIERTIEAKLSPLLLIDKQLKARKRAAWSCYPSQIVEVHRRGVLEHLARLAQGDSGGERWWVMGDAGCC